MRQSETYQRVPGKLRRGTQEPPQKMASEPRTDRKRGFFLCIGCDGNARNSVKGMSVP